MKFNILPDTLIIYLYKIFENIRVRINPKNENDHKNNHVRVTNPNELYNDLYLVVTTNNTFVNRTEMVHNNKIVRVTVMITEENTENQQTHRDHFSNNTHDLQIRKMRTGTDIYNNGSSKGNPVIVNYLNNMEHV